MPLSNSSDAEEQKDELKAGGGAAEGEKKEVEEAADVEETASTESVEVDTAEKKREQEEGAGAGEEEAAEEEAKHEEAKKENNEDEAAAAAAEEEEEAAEEIAEQVRRERRRSSDYQTDPSKFHLMGGAVRDKEEERADKGGVHMFGLPRSKTDYIEFHLFTSETQSTCFRIAPFGWLGNIVQRGRLACGKDSVAALEHFSLAAAEGFLSVCRHSWWSVNKPKVLRKDRNRDRKDRAKANTSDKTSPGNATKRSNRKSASTGALKA